MRGSVFHSAEEDPLVGAARRQLCKEKGIDVLLVRAPRHDWTWADYEGLQKFADEHGVPYLDMNTDEIITEMGIDSKTDMSNKHHLNYKGAEEMTRWLGDYITEHYDIDTTDATDSTKAQMKENIVYYDEVVAKYAK